MWHLVVVHVKPKLYNWLMMYYFDRQTDKQTCDVRSTIWMDVHCLILNDFCCNETVFLVIASQSSNAYISNFTLSTHVAMEGESLTAVCDVTSEGKSTFFIIFVKKTVESNQPVEIATNGHVNSDFNNTGRYAASYHMEIPGDTKRVHFFLNISSKT